jgi:transcriptional regulator with GAF, ATPase, and Fis domain
MDSAPQPGDSRETLEALVRRCSGNLSAIARELSQGGKRITRQAVTRRLEKHSLLDLVAQLAVAAGVSGKRRHTSVEAKAHKAERARILAALATSANYDAAAAPLGLPLRTLYNRISRYAITQAEVERKRDRLARSTPKRAAAK